MNEILNMLFLPEKLDKTYHKKCVEFIRWVDEEIGDRDTYSLDVDFAKKARKRIDGLKAVGDYLKEVQENEKPEEK